VFYVRAARNEDLPGLLQAAEHLDSVNLPHDEDRLAKFVDHSQQSFAGTVARENREFLLVLVEREGPQERTIGTGLIFAQHGTMQAPHMYFDVIKDERYSETLDKHFRHTLLRLGSNYRGMTEVGGLVVLPSHRKRPEKLGALLAYARFLYIALHRDGFMDKVVSELMPPLEPDGTSLLWEALGRRFTGLTYQEADRLSRENKEFIRALFPQDPISATLLDPKARALIGQVGPASKPVEHMLRHVGFSYSRRIDPFDGGPHFHARTDRIRVVQATRRATVRAVIEHTSAGAGGAIDALVAVDAPGPVHVRIVHCPVLWDSASGDDVVLPAVAAETLEVEAGHMVGLVPLSP
jgi:arginine N-succinyltransferase